MGEVGRGRYIRTFIFILRERELAKVKGSMTDLAILAVFISGDSGGELHGGVIG